MKNVFKAIQNRIKYKIEYNKRLNYARKSNVLSNDERMRQINEVWEKKILISVITPLYNTQEFYLRDLISSLEKQTYSNWELCLADASDSEHPYVETICKKAEDSDCRIRYFRLGRNGGIADNTNQCLQIARGEYIGLLDHDDILHEAALYEVAKEIERTGADFLYSDEVKFHEDIKTATDFNFKNTFSKDELRSHNYICHFTVFRKSLLDENGVLFRKEYDGSQDHDLFLRLTEKAKRIVHIPKVLYFWRVHEQSVSMNLDSKSYAVDAAIRAVQEQLDRTGESGTVESNLPYRTIYRIRYLLKPSKVSVIYWTDKKWEEDEKKHAIEEVISKTEGQEYEILIPVFDKEDESESIVKMIKVRQVYVVQHRISAILNQLTEKSCGEEIVYLYRGCKPRNREWLQEMQMYVQRTDIGVVGAKLYSSDGKIYSGGVGFDWRRENPIIHFCHGEEGTQQGYEAMLHLVRNVMAVSQECFMIKKNTWEILQGYSDDAEGYEVIDFCLKAQMKGLNNVWTCFSELDITEGYFKTESKKVVMKWEKQLRDIESINVNLLLLKLV